MTQEETPNQSAIGNGIAQAHDSSNANVNTNTPVFNININSDFGLRPDDLTASPSSEHLPFSKSVPLVWNIPYQRNLFFTGRKEILTQLRNSLAEAKTTSIQPCAINGLGGVGKTQVAIEYAYLYSSEYQTILWVKAEKRETLIDDFVTIAHLLNLPEKNNQDLERTISAVQRWFMQHTKWLLILDNADDLILIRDFLPTMSRGHIILTTRAQAVGGLAKRLEIEKMGLEEGKLFLLRRINLITEDASFDTFSSAANSKAQEIVKAMDGLPLALDQAGAFIEESKCTLADYVALYEKQKGTLLKRRGTLVSDHPEPVATTWALSFEKVIKVNPAAGDLLRLCSFLAPDAIPEELFTTGASELGPILEPIATDSFEWNAAIQTLLSFSYYIVILSPKR